MASSTFYWDFTNGVRCDSNGILITRAPDIFYQQHPSWQVSFKANAAGVLSALNVSSASTWAAAIDTTYANSGDPCCRTLNADIDSSGAASGNIVVSLDANTSSFLTAIASATDGRVAGYFELRGLDVSGEMIYYAYFPVSLRNTIDPSGGTPPAPTGNYYNKSETDALVGAKLSDAASDGKQYCRKNGAWSEISVTGIGDVVGPSSSTDHNFPMFNGTSGKTLEDSGYGPSSFSAANHNHATVYEPYNANIQNHISSTSNPHSVTKTQVNLGNVSNDAQLKIASNLSDLNSASTARTNLGLGGAAVLNVGTGSGTVAAGDDARFGNATTLQSRALASTAPTDGQAIVWDNANSTWKPGTVSGGGSGDVVGPASSTDNAITRFDSTTGKLLQNSLATIDDNGSVNIPTGQAYKINGTALAKGDIGLGNVPNTDCTNASNLGSGTVPAARGGAGTANGILKADGSGNVSAATAGTDYASAANLDFAGGRLTLTTATPVMTADSTSSATLYYTPYRNNLITLYTGSVWKTIIFSELSLSLSALNGVYDVFAYDNSGTVALEALAWTSTTARATALAYQDGRLVKSGAATRRYLGTINVSSGTSYAVLKSEAAGGSENCKLDVWNYYNRALTRLHRRDTTSSWTYSTNAYRQANGAAGNQCNFVIGVAEDSILANLAAVTNSNSTSYGTYNAIAYDKTNNWDAVAQNYNIQTASTQVVTYTIIPAIGLHYIAWTETISASGTQTQYGSSSAGLTVNISH